MLWKSCATFILNPVVIQLICLKQRSPSSYPPACIAFCSRRRFLRQEGKQMYFSDNSSNYSVRENNEQFISGTRVSWIPRPLPLLPTHLLLLPLRRRGCSRATTAPASRRRRLQGTRGVETRKRLVLRRISGRVGSRRTARPPHPLLPMRLLLLLLRRRWRGSVCATRASPSRRGRLTRTGGVQTWHDIVRRTVASPSNRLIGRRVGSSRTADWRTWWRVGYCCCL